MSYLMYDGNHEPQKQPIHYGVKAEMQSREESVGKRYLLQITHISFVASLCKLDIIFQIPIYYP